MSDLVAIAYDDQETAETVRRTLWDLARGHVIQTSLSDEEKQRLRTALGE